MQKFIIQHNINSLEYLSRVLKKEFELSSNDQDLIRKLRTEEHLHEVFLRKLNIECTVSNKLYFINVLFKKVDLNTFLKVQEKIIETKYKVISQQQSILFLKSSLNSYNKGWQEETPKQDISLAFLTFSSFVGTIFDHLGKKSTYFMVKCSNLAHRFVIAHFLNRNNFTIKVDPFYTIKGVADGMVKPICTFNEFKEITFLDNTSKELGQRDHSKKLFDKINNLIKQVNYDLKLSIRKLIDKKFSPIIYQSNLEKILANYCPANLHVFHRDYHYILYLLQYYIEEKNSQSFIILCDAFQRRQIENYLEELLMYFHLIATLITYKSDAIDLGAIFEGYTLCIINKPILQLTNNQVRVSNHTFSTIIRAFDYAIPYFQSVIITEVLPQLTTLI